MPPSGMYQGRNFGCNFGVGATSGPCPSKIGGERPAHSLLAKCCKTEAIDLAVAIISVEFLGIKYSFTILYHAPSGWPKHLAGALKRAVNTLPSA
jgi:hypothetical protein